MIKIRYKRKDYLVNKEKLLAIISILNCKKIKETQVSKFMKKFRLYDENFLKNINRL
ncbi:hypothetical protein IJX73_02400 [bacterium]|nr:hypothetical protein [bacterium]